MLAPPPPESRSDMEATAHALVRWIDRYHRQAGGMQFRASLADAGAADIPTLMVEVSGEAGPIATYKCGISDRDAPAGWLMLAPLVVVWNGARPSGSGGLGRAMIEHLIAAARTFRESPVSRGERVLIGSGNLTRAKAGRPFFESLGWEIVLPALRSPRHLYAQERVAAALAAIEGRIERAVAPLVEAGKIEAEPVSFAVLALP